MRPKLTALALLAVAATIAVACSGDDDGEEPSASDPPGAAATLTPGPLRVILGSGEAAPNETEPVTVVEGEVLEPDEIESVLELLPEWTVPEPDTSGFERPAESLPPPRTGETIDAPFPAPAPLPAPEVPTGPLEVARFQPEGEVPVAPYLSVTFNQPMVPLATLDQLEAEDPPVTITPDLAGRWQWIGTRTLRFDYQSDDIDRLPMATQYTVEIPAGTESETGGTLAESVTWSFATPAPQVQQLVPEHDSLPLEPVFVATFDQRVDPEAVLAKTTVIAGDEQVDLRLAGDDEIAADEQAASIVEQAPEGRWVAFRAVDPLEPDTALEVVVGPEVPSAEGPRTAEATKAIRPHTYAPLRVEERNCSGEQECLPTDTLQIRFNNALDLEAFDPSLVTVAPEPAGWYVDAFGGETLTIVGNLQANTTYEVLLDAALADEFGQTLGEGETVTFAVGEPRPSLEQFGEGLVTLDPMAEAPVLPISAVGHDELRVRAYAVDPSTDWRNFQLLVEQYWEYDEDRPAPPWPVVLDDVVPTGAQDGGRTEVPIDLSAVIPDGIGHTVVLIEPTGAFASLSQEDDGWWENQPVLVWVQATQIGLDAVMDGENLTAWATALTTGEPMAGVNVSLLGGSGQATDETGLATLPFAEGDILTELVATSGDDLALLPTGGITARTPEDQLLWTVFDDRGMYRPGETVHVKGWVRRLPGSDRQLALLAEPIEITWNVRDAQNATLAEGQASVSDLGGFDLTFDIPAGANLGDAWLALQAPLPLSTAEAQHPFQIQEFRRPEFEVTTEAASPAPYFVDQAVDTSVSATYYAGGPLPEAPVEWNVFTNEATYAPPGWEDFTFGVWQPWWYEDIAYGYGGYGYDEGFEVEPPYGPDGEPEVETFAATTDGDGRHVLEITFDGDGEGLPTTVTAEATVTDVNRQAWTSRSDFLVHPGELYVGVRSASPYVQPGEDLRIDAIVTDLDGAAVGDRAFVLESGRVEEELVNGEWEEEVVDTETCEEVSAEEAVTCTFSPETPGRYRITATVVDDRGRTSRTELTRWVAGGEPVPSRGVDQEVVELIPDAEEYAPGDVAEVLVQAPFSDATGLLSVSRGDRVSTETFAIEGFAATVAVPIEEDHVPNLTVRVDLVGITPRTDAEGVPVEGAPARPAFAQGEMDLPVPPVGRTLEVTAEPRDTTVLPGGETTVDLTVLDASGAPVADAELAVVVVDEAVLALTGYELVDPLTVFYGPIFSEVWSRHGRDLLRLLDVEELAAAGGGAGGSGGPASTLAPLPATGPGDESAGQWTDSTEARDAYGGDADAGVGGQAGTAITPRTDFDPLAVFEPAVSTDSEGHATVPVPVPDNLTRYRVMVVAADGADHFGTAEANITARLPLMVRPSAPRFLNFGDTFELPVVVANQSDEDREVDVVIETANLTLTEGAGRRVTVPANDRVEVRFPATTDEVGPAQFRAAVRSGDGGEGDGGGDGDAAEVSLPVYTPATAEAFATYGVLDEGAVLQSLEAPEGVFPQFGGLEVDTSSTALQALTDAVLYVHEYDFESADAYAARILTVVSLQDVLGAFGAEGLPPPDELTAGVAGDIDGLVQLQQADGGFRAWSGSPRTDPFGTILSVQALAVAREQGYAVPADALERGLGYLRDIESHFPADYGQNVRDTLTAYALNVRGRAGDRDTLGAALLFGRAGDSLGVDALAWLWPVLDDPVARDAIEQTLANRVTETAGAATFATDYGDDAYLLAYSDRRTDGIVLDSLITEAPDSDLIPKVVAGLLGNQTRGRWNNIQENTFILLALHRYFETFEAVTPDFVARVWLGDLYAGEHAYAGRTTDRGRTLVPMTELVEGGDDDLIVQKDGAGRLYYRLGLRYAPDDLDLDPLDRGFVVQRTYEGVDDPDDVTRDEDGVWHFRAGAKVRVTLSLVAESRRTHAILLDPLPAGTEPLNPALAVTETLPPLDDVPDSDEYVPYEGGPDGVSPSGDLIYPWWRWYEHENLRDDRAEAYTPLLSAGTYEYSYITRATTPGRFVVPPTRAEEIYAPETFGRGASAVVVVEDR